MRPRSRGAIHLTGSDPSAPVAIDANPLSDPDDLRDLQRGLSMARDIGRSVVLRPYIGQEVFPGSDAPEELERFLLDGLSAGWHPSGTARMGRNAQSVVDGRLRVHGIEGLRVADASVLPRVPAGGTMAACVVVGEQAAAFLKRDRPDPALIPRASISRSRGSC